MRCNRCGRDNCAEGIRVEKQWGYFSKKDGELHSFFLCEDCYDQIVRELKIQPDIKEQVEYV